MKWWWTLVGIATGCAASGERHQDTWGATESRRPTVAATDGGARRLTRPVSSPPRLTLVRSEVDAVLTRGLQPFVASIEVEAVLVERRFVGWRLVRLPTSARASPIDVVEEDIVTRVNALPVERPGDWVKIWDELRRAPELKIEIIRGGDLRTRRFPILRD